jgi:hypothetical protein
MTYTFTRTGAQIEGIHNTVDDPKSNAQFSDDIRTISGEYRGLWPGAGGSANKGDTYQTQVGGTGTGQYFTALQNTTADPVGDDANWRSAVSAESLSQYTDIVYKASGGKSAVENLLADFNLNPLMYAIGTIIKTGGTTFEYKDSTGAITLSNFRAFNGKCCFDFGIKGDGTPESPAKISEFLQLAGTLLFPDGTYSISEAMEIQSNSRIFNDGLFVASGILVNEESVIFFRDCDNVETHNLRADCGLFPANSGVIIRDNTSQIRLYNTSVENAAWDAARGGGRGIIIEANSGSPADIIVSGLYCRKVDTPFALNGYTGYRKNNVVVSNIVADNCEKLVALFGNGAGYPHSGDSQSCVISNVTGNNIRQPLRFDRASNATISNFYVYNDNTVPISAFIQGLCSNVVFSGSYDHQVGGTTPTALYNNSSWKDDGTSPDEGFATHKSEFNIKQTGQVSNLLAQGLTRDQCFDTLFEIHSDEVLSDQISTAQFITNTSVFVEVYNSEHNSRVTGFVDDIGNKTLSSLSGEDYSPSRMIGDVKFEQKSMVPLLDNDYAIGSDDKRLSRLYAREGVRVLAPNGVKYILGVDSSGAPVATPE